ncbi:ABC transporter permease [Ammoniphilus resinae]|uniref:Tungstate transport system permease protein n=1 Tax=Ammoniphilus resinae TaxID=861532 RepID=A0ABS4GR29_9BACL|nr:ABC transporter permease [Ammoniphilus resinae]MBP1932726.1 tungstate transport system permease protein [Ammoniphilus resinae]
MPFSQDVISVILLSLQVSTVAIVIGVLIGIPFGSFLGLYAFPGKRLLTVVIYTLMGLPPVLIGVIVYLLLSKHGPLGSLQWLFTPQAMMVAQSILVTPIIIGLSMSAVQAKEQTYLETIRSLGATPAQTIWTIIKESRKGIWAGVATAYGRAISEVGAVMLVGGNIEGHTRVMTTAIILETRMGNFDAALQLGAVLLIISFILNNLLVMGILADFRSRRRKES